MIGGVGADKFVFKGGEIFVLDFERGVDKLDLSGNGYSAEFMNLHYFADFNFTLVAYADDHAQITLSGNVTASDMAHDFIF